MENLVIKKENLKEFIENLEYLKHGGNGIIFKYNDTELLKVFYNNYFDVYNNQVMNKVIEEIKEKTELEHIKRILFSNHISSDERIKTLIKRLDNTNCNTLFKGIITIDNYLMATILNNYQGYKQYQEIYNSLTRKQNIEILNKIVKLIEELITNSIYPTDIKLENIMINKSNLDVKLVDLDDSTTILTDKRDEYYRYIVARRFANIRKKIINS